MRTIIDQPLLSMLFGLVFIIAIWSSTQASGQLSDRLIHGMKNTLQQTSDKGIEHLKFKECLTPE